MILFSKSKKAYYPLIQQCGLRSGSPRCHHSHIPHEFALPGAANKALDAVKGIGFGCRYWVWH